MPIDRAWDAPGLSEWEDREARGRHGAPAAGVRDRNVEEAPADAVSLGAGEVAAPLIVVLFIVAMLLPEETSFYLGSIRMTAARLLLIVTTPYILSRLSAYVSTADYRFIWNDALVPLLGVWMVLSTCISESFERGLVFGGTTALEFCMPYLLARACLSQRGEALAAMKWLLCALSVVGFLALADWAANKAIIKETLSQLTGYTKVFMMSRYDWRLGLLRAWSVSDHPIHLGVMTGFGLLLSTAYHGRTRWFIVAGCLTGLVGALSSAPLAAFFLGVALMVYDAMFQRTHVPARLFLFGLAGLAIFAVFMVSRNPWAFIFNQITFDPTTGAYRLMQWQFFWPAVMESPWVGIGESLDFIQDLLVPSVDSLWLRAAMTFGVPGAALTIAVFFGSLSIPVRRGDSGLNLTSDENQLAYAIGVVLVIGAFVATTVYFWNMVWMLTGFLAGVRAALGNLAALPREEDLDLEVSSAVLV